MKNLIFSSFVSRPTANKTHRISNTVYFQNLIVSLSSAKQQNPLCDVAIIIPFSKKKEMPKWFVNDCRRFEILLIEKNFTYFNDSINALWSFSLFPLSLFISLYKENEYDNILFIDSDTFSNRPFDDIWEDDKDFILLYDIIHNHSATQAKDQSNEYFQYCGKRIYFTNYGGEFISGSSKNLALFSEEALKMYTVYQEKKINYQHGIESFISPVAYEFQKSGKLLIKSANPYVYRYWTGYHFKSLSLNYKYNSICVFHVPDEKNVGMLKIYRKIKKHGKTNSKYAIRKLGLTCISLPRLSYLFYKVSQRLTK